MLKPSSNRIFLLITFSFIFALVDNLFLGVFIWNHFTVIGFFVFSLLSIPITTIFKFQSYYGLYLLSADHFDLEKFKNKLINLATDPKVVIGFILSITCASFLYLTNYGALYIQILKFFMNNIGITYYLSSGLTTTLVLFSVVPDAISYANSLYKRILTFFQLKLSVKTKKIPYLLGCLVLAAVIAFVFAHIEYTQLINSYQHYLIEVSKLVIPYVHHKYFVLSLIFFRTFIQLCELGQYILVQIGSLFASHPGSEKISKYKTSYFEYLILTCLAGLRAVSRFITAGELASNPWKFDAKSWAAAGSVMDDFDQYRSNDDYSSFSVTQGNVLRILLIVTIILFVCAIIFFQEVQIDPTILLTVASVSIFASWYYPPKVVECIYHHSSRFEEPVGPKPANKFAQPAPNNVNMNKMNPEDSHDENKLII
ncbi:MAG: hypothetical protein VX335_01975 [Pseudomonadota bacterium]|nr:hypothetical protein [Pseudomonadota bacterium]